MLTPTYDLIVPEEYLHGRPPEEFAALRVAGDAAYPLYHHGDMLLVDTAAEPCGGEPVVALCQGTLQLGSIGDEGFRPLDPCLPSVNDYCAVGVPVLLIRSTL